MTDRLYALTVVLEKDIREDDAKETIIPAIKMIKGVTDVKGSVRNIETFMAETRARDFYRDKLMDILFPPKDKQ